MSYILDALKKSEQQRQRGAAPSLLAAQVTTEAPRPPATLFYGLAAAALVIVGVAIGMLRPWWAEAPAPQSVAMKPREPVAPPAPPAPAPASVEITIKTERQAPAAAPPPQPAQTPAGDVVKPQAPAPATPARQVPAPATPAQQVPAPATPAQQMSAPVAPAQQVPVPAAPAQNVVPATASAPENKALPSASAKPAGARPQDVAPERPPMTMAELPLAIQQEIPKLSISFHIYSGNPKARLVGINDRMLHEGDSVEPGLVLEQITPDGMILTYKGYRFLRGPR